jgi:hypothetical protein
MPYLREGLLHGKRRASMRHESVATGQLQTRTA